MHSIQPLIRIAKKKTHQVICDFEAENLKCRTKRSSKKILSILELLSYPYSLVFSTHFAHLESALISSAILE